MDLGNEGFKNSEKLTKWVRYFLYIQIAIAFVSMVSGYMEYRLLTNFQNGVYTSQSLAMADAVASDKRQGIIALVYTLVYIFSGVFILKWIYRANYNAHKLGAEGMEFTSGWSVGWYFIPFANLWKPYQAMKEIWKTSHSPSDWRNVDVGAILPCWWFLWLASGLFGNVAFRMSLRADKIDELLNVNFTYQAFDLISILLALVMLGIVNSIYKFQMKHAAVVS